MAQFYVIYNLDKKLTIYTDWLTKYRTRIEEVYTQLKVIDDRNLFEKDDDVGFVFSELLNTISDFDAEIK